MGLRRSQQKRVGSVTPLTSPFEKSSAQPPPLMTRPWPITPNSVSPLFEDVRAKQSHLHSVLYRTHEPVYFQFTFAAITVVIAAGGPPLSHEHPRLGDIRAPVGLMPLRE
ncbi:hypothetical protein BS47DRAFT_741927 [Hydnum rufescens UP504]|uniref:Uncharacterized protein n=1 Tax=Hydnum rufescens UP504 TaxID=1448309 RepID=A0A9P6B1N1_9AGAM|nr:hypothetical protein BS47DRAFT_741927 [Hydnum rufescens UP504]